MRLLSKTIFILGLIVLGFQAKSVFAFNCTVVAGGGNWNSSATWTSCNSTTPQNGDDIILDATSGNLAVNVATAQLKSLTMTGYTGTMSGAGGMQLTGQTASTQNIILDGTITWTGTLTINPTTATANFNLTTNGRAIQAMAIGGSTGDITLQDNLTFSAVKTSTLTVPSGTGGDLFMNGFTIAGNSDVNRVLIQSDSLGSVSRPINRQSGAFANADFRDIDLEASYDCSAITGLCGDALGNSADFTFTAGQTQYWVGNGGSWSSAAEWGTSSGGAGGRVPLPQDDVVFDNNSFSGVQTATSDMPRGGRTIDWSAYTEAQASWGRNLSPTTYGSVILGTNAMANGGNGHTLMGRGSFIFTSNGVTWNQTLTVNMFGGTLTFQDAFTATFGATLGSGVMDTDYNFTVPTFASSGAGIRTINMGPATWTLNGTGVVWNVVASLVTVPETSTIDVSNVTTTAKTFAGAGETYNAVTFSGCNITTTGNNTYATLNNNTAGCARGFLPTGASTSTITSLYSTNATSTAAYGYASSTNASIAELKFTGSQVCTDYGNFTNILATPASTWYVGTNSTSTNSSGLIFTACPAPGASSSTPFIIYWN